MVVDGVKIDAVVESGRNLASKQHIQPGLENVWDHAVRNGRTRLARPSGADGDWENVFFPVQLTSSRIGNLTRFIHTLLHVMTIIYSIATTIVSRTHWATTARSGPNLSGRVSIVRQNPQPNEHTFSSWCSFICCFQKQQFDWICQRCTINVNSSTTTKEIIVIVDGVDGNTEQFLLYTAFILQF